MDSAAPACRGHGMRESAVGAAMVAGKQHEGGARGVDHGQRGAHLQGTWDERESAVGAAMVAGKQHEGGARGVDHGQRGAHLQGTWMRGSSISTPPLIHASTGRVNYQPSSCSDTKDTINSNPQPCRETWYSTVTPICAAPPTTATAAPAHLVVDGVKLGEHDAVDEVALGGVGAQVREALVELGQLVHCGENKNEKRGANIKDSTAQGIRVRQPLVELGQLVHCRATKGMKERVVMR